MSDTLQEKMMYLDKLCAGGVTLESFDTGWILFSEHGTPFFDGILGETPTQCVDKAMEMING